MPSSRDPEETGRRRGGLRRLVLAVLVLVLLLALLVGGTAVAVLERAPLVTRLPEATPEVARATRNVVHRVRALDEVGSAEPVLSLTQEELQSVADFGARLVPGARGQVELRGEAMEVRGSVPVPLLPGRWLNVEAVVPPFEGEATFAAVRVGGIDLPPALATALLESAGNLVLGGGMGTKVRDAVPRIVTAPGAIEVTVISDPAMRSAFTRRTFGTLRSGDMPSAGRMRAHYLALRRAIDAGELPVEGSFLPYLHWVMESARARAEPGEGAQEFTAAVFALTRACGAVKFGLVVGRLIDGVVVPEKEPEWRHNCTSATLSGRIDTRRHFITAAAIKAASTMRVSFAIGEFKELTDSLGSSGFDFTDIVANASGIRFAETVMATPMEDWPALAARLGSEADVVASFEGVPGRQTWESFRAAYGQVDSPEYNRMVARIERRIDGLPFHEGRPAWDGAVAAGLAGAIPTD